MHARSQPDVAQYWSVLVRCATCVRTNPRAKMATLFLCVRQRAPHVTSEGTRTIGSLDIWTPRARVAPHESTYGMSRTRQRWSTRDMPLTIPRLLTSHPIGCCNAQLPAFATLVHDGMKRRQSQDHYGMPNSECHVLQRNMRITPYNNASSKDGPSKRSRRRSTASY